MSSQKLTVDSRNRNNTSNANKNNAKGNNKVSGKETEDNEQKPSQCDENGKEEEDLQKEEEEKRVQEQKQAEEIVQEAHEHLETKLALRKQNIDAPRNRPQESFFRGLDSNIKKNSSFIKKLKTMTEQQKQSLTQEFNGLNLTRFIQEAVCAIVEGLHKLKVADVSVVVHVCGLFHQRYAEFTGAMTAELMKMFENYNCKDEEKASNVNKYRVGLRLLAELCIYGIIVNLEEGTKLLISTLSNITNCDMETHLYLPVILSFCRHCGEDVLGIISRKQRLLSEKYNVTIPRSEIIPSERQAAVFSILKVYYESLVSHLLQEHKELQKKEKQNRQILLSKGELHEDRKEAYEKCQKSYDKLLTNTSTLAEILDQDMPDLPESESLPEEDASGGINIFNPFKLTEYDGDTGLWEDEDTRTFYENLKDLKSLVPSILYKESSKGDNSEVNPDPKKTPKDELVNGLVDENDEIMSDEEDSFNEVSEDYDQEDPAADDNNPDAAVGSQNNPLSNQLEQIIQRLPTCVNRNFIDDLATDFVMTCNTKGNRKKLCKALFSVPRTRFDLLPFYSRLVATLHPCMPDLAVELFSCLRSEFKWHIRKKDQIYVESKVKTVRFIGELTKFNMVPRKETLHCLKILLDNFTHHNVDMACSLLETCGRFLFRSADSHIKTKNFLEQMMRKKAVQNLDSRQKTMIDNAFYYTNPPERQKVTRKQRPPLQEYVRKLIYKDLSKTTTEKVLRQLRKLPWDQEEVVTYVVRCLIRSWNIKYSNIHCAANLLAGLVPYHERVGIEVVDGVLEEIRIGMEINVPKMNQCRISSVKYLGELYNYQLIESNVIFTVLYSFITFGSTDDGAPSLLDPPEHLFRIRLVCILLDTCGQYFDRGSLKRKLDCFIVYFQAYIWKKKTNSVWNENFPFPKEVEYMVADTVESLRPKLNMYSSLEEAVRAVEELNKEYQMKIDEVVKVTASEGKPASKPVPMTMTDTKRGPHSGSSVVSSSPRALEREEDESETGESEAEEMDFDEGDDGNKRKRGGDSFNLDDDEISEIDSEQEGEVQLKGISGPKLVPCEEDTDFQSEFNKLIIDDFQSRRTDNVKVPSFDVAVPMQLGKKKANSDEGSRVNFLLMLKKGNKQQLRDLKVPITSDLAANIREKQQEEQAEQEEVKRLVLDYNQRQEEETYNEFMAQTKQSSPGNRFRGRRENKPKQANRSRDTETGFFMNKRR